MLRIFADLTNNQFASSFQDRSALRLAISQNNDLPFRLYLLQSLSSPRWPYSYDSWSGDPDVTTIVSLRDTSTAAALASTVPLNVIKNGFQGLLHTNTAEVSAYLSGRLERDTQLSIDLVDASGNKITPFQQPVTLRATDTASEPFPVSPGVYYERTVNDYTQAAAIPTANRTIGSVFLFWINGILNAYRLEAGTATTDLPAGIIRPNDYDATTNPVNLVRGLGI